MMYGKLLKGFVTAKTWIAEDGADNASYWCDGDLSEVNVAAVDTDEVRLSVFIGQYEGSEDVGLYLTRSEAARLSVLLAAASIAEAE